MLIAGKFKVLKQIGRGAFGVALLVRPVEGEEEAENGQEHSGGDSSIEKGNADESSGDNSADLHLDGTEVVIKKIDCTMMSKNEIAEAMNEVAVLRSLANGNPFIIGYRSAFDDAGSLHIVLDYAENGDLSQIISKTKAAKNRFTQAKVLDWFVQIASALRFIHSRNIMHRDLKTQNVFLDRYWQVKLGDFGIAKVLQSTTAKANTIVGTPYYLSPELCEDKPYDKKSDVWALGCVLYELCTLRHAFEGRNMCALVLRIVKGKFAPIDVGRRTGYTMDMRNLVNSLLAQNPKHRPTVPMILKKPFIQAHIQGMEIHGRVNIEHAIMDISSQSLEKRLKLGDARSSRQRRARQGRVSSSQSPGLGTRGKLLAKKKRKKKEAQARRESQQREFELHKRDIERRARMDKQSPPGFVQGSNVHTVFCAKCNRELIPPENAPRFLCPCGEIQYAKDAPTRSQAKNNSAVAGAANTAGTTTDESSTNPNPDTPSIDASEVHSSRFQSKDDNDVDAKTEMERMRARQMRLLQGLTTPRGEARLSSSFDNASTRSPSRMTEEEKQIGQGGSKQHGDEAIVSDRDRSREAARQGKDPRSLDMQYQSLLQQYAQVALQEENIIFQAPDKVSSRESNGGEILEKRRFSKHSQDRRQNDDVKSHAKYAAGNAYSGRPGDPKRVRAEISKFVERRRQIDPVAADIRFRERQRKKQKHKEERLAKEAYMEKLKRREKEFRLQRALVKQKSEDAGRKKVIEHRKRLKNAKATINVKELRKKFANQKDDDHKLSSKGGSEHTVTKMTCDTATANKNVEARRLKPSDRQQARPPRQRGSTIEAIRQAKRRHRLAAMTGENTHDRNEVPVEVFVPKGYSFDMESSEDTKPTTSSTSIEASGYVDEKAKTKERLGESFSVGGTECGESLQDAFKRRRKFRTKKNKARKEMPDALDEFVGNSTSSENIQASEKKNPFRRSATEAVDESIYDADGIIEGASEEVFKEQEGFTYSDSKSKNDVSLPSTLTPRQMSHKRPPSPPLAEAANDYGSSDHEGHYKPVDSPFIDKAEFDSCLADAPLPWEDSSNLLGDTTDSRLNEDDDHSDSDGMETGSMEIQESLAAQLRCCDEFSKLQTPMMIDEEDEDVNLSSVQDSRSGSPHGGTLAARCLQLRRVAEGKVGVKLFNNCYKYLQAVLLGDDLDTLDLDDHGNASKFYDVVASSGISRESSSILCQEMLLLIHLETALAAASTRSTAN